MKIFEVIDFEPRKTTQSVSNNIRPSKINNINLNDTNAGSYSSVYMPSSQKRLNQIIKISKKHKFDNAYVLYLKMIDDFNKNGGNNPYFPVIHDLKIYHDDKDNLQFNVKMERLFRFQNLKIYDNEDLINSLKEMMFGSTDESIHTYLVEYLYSEGTEGFIKDKKLKQALDMIIRLKINNDEINYDLHKGNLMWRITGNMPQLVITDPLA